MFRPLRGFIDAVNGAQHVFFPAAHTFGVDPLFNELFVAKVFLKPDIGHRDHHRNISGWTYRDPLTGNGLRSRRISWLNRDYRDAAFPGPYQGINNMIAQGCPRIEPPENDKF